MKTVILFNSRDELLRMQVKKNYYSVKATGWCWRMATCSR
jgi:hypothetical protein